MKYIIESIKYLVKDFLKTCSLVEPINDLGDYYRMKRWVKKVSVLYAVFSFFSLLVIFFALSHLSLFDFPLLFVYRAFYPVL